MAGSLLNKLAAIAERHTEVAKLIVDPEIITDMSRYTRLMKEYKDLEPIVNAHKEYSEVISNIESAKQVIANETDTEFKEMAKMELDSLEARKIEMDEEVKVLLIPKDPEDDKNAVMEIRAGTGGDEASIFAGDLFRMYSKYISDLGFKIEMVDYNEGTSGGYKEVIFNVTGTGAYGELKFEAGVHRVQRVPQTETQGRIHTSAATVIVMPEAEEFDIDLNVNDIRRDEFCSSGPGGQSVNTTYSAIRLTHLPTGIVVQCQDEKSKLKNYDKALKVLRSRIYEMELQKRLEEESKKRKSMVTTGDRSAKIRTYNYPQGRVTDHRINLTLYNLSSIIDGDIKEIVEALKLAENTEKLKEGETA
ncbi:MAG: peptide chain release factor 1 [Flavobacteriales bacterium]|nr:peptide chain release factor 1 [Flavobacteriales bacterium]NNK81243.1 peptide chain release factor 1 [Flavobacteriales bacterium]